jgi:uncharacterized Fe-S cluster-containing radical SAM superfamily protein
MFASKINPGPRLILQREHDANLAVSCRFSPNQGAQKMPLNKAPLSATLAPMPDTNAPSAVSAKFTDPDVTARGEPRASVAFTGFKTLWLNTGTLCNIACARCYIESTPTNDRLVYLTPDDVGPLLEELAEAGTGPIEIGITGGEPFLNPSIIEITAMALAAGHRVLLLTNAMRPMMRPRVQKGLLVLGAHYGDRLVLRVSLDHWSAELHDSERGAGGFDETCAGIDWLAANGFSIALAGRTCWGETEADSRAGFEALITARSWPIDASDPARLVLFPEMDEGADVPEITPACWGILHVNPADMMCASSRMVVKRKGETKAEIVSCTLLPYDPQFSMGVTLAQSMAPVKLNHPHCARFCVLGGGSCSA